MKIPVCLFISCFFSSSCAHRTHEHIIEHDGITISWYNDGSGFVFTNEHQCVDLKRNGWTFNIMESNTETVEQAWINKDTVTIKAVPGQHIYYLAAYVLGTHIKIDTSKFHQ